MYDDGDAALLSSSRSHPRGNGVSVHGEHARCRGRRIEILAVAENQPAEVEEANARLQTELDRLHAVGVEATGTVAVKAPLAAVRDAVAADHSYAGIVVATPPLGLSKLIGFDLPHRAQREFKMPVEWIESRTDDPSEATTVNMTMPRSSTRYL